MAHDDPRRRRGGTHHRGGGAAEGDGVRDHRGTSCAGGLYTAVLPMLLYAFFGSSRPLSVSTTTTIAILTAAELARPCPSAAPGLIAAAATLAALTGACSRSPASSASAFSRSSSPIRCSSASRRASASSSSWTSCRNSSACTSTRPAGCTTRWPRSGSCPVSLPTAMIALVTVALLVGLERFLPRSPAPLIAIGAAIALSAVMGLESSEYPSSARSRRDCRASRSPHRRSRE